MTLYQALDFVAQLLARKLSLGHSNSLLLAASLRGLTWFCLRNNSYNRSCTDRKSCDQWNRHSSRFGEWSHAFCFSYVQHLLQGFGRYIRTRRTLTGRCLGSNSGNLFFGNENSLRNENCPKPMLAAKVSLKKSHESLEYFVSLKPHITRMILARQCIWCVILHIVRRPAYEYNADCG